MQGGTLVGVDPHRCICDSGATSAWAGRFRPEERIAHFTEHLRKGHFEVLTSPAIYAEHRAALLCPGGAHRDGLSEEEIEGLLFPFSQIVVVQLSVEPVCRDPHDDMFFACALAAEADCIVSDDDELKAVGTYHGTRVISSGTFLALLDSSPPTDSRAKLPRIGPTG